MPVITVESAMLNKAQKEEMAKQLTKSAAEIMQLPEESIYIFIRENSFENVGVGGTLLSNKTP